MRGGARPQHDGDAGGAAAAGAARPGVHRGAHGGTLRRQPARGERGERVARGGAARGAREGVRGAREADGGDGVAGQSRAHRMAQNTFTFYLSFSAHNTIVARNQSFNSVYYS